MRVTLQEWNESYFARPKARRTLYHYIKNGKIYPSPVKVGRDYEVEANAILLDRECINNTNSIMERINGQKTQQRKRGIAS